MLEDAGLDQVLVNARHVKHVPGRKTDVKDAVWLCELLEVGLLRSSLVPPAVIRELRDLTRYRKRLVQDRTSEVQRVEKTLEDAVVKIRSMAFSTLSKSGRAMIEALIAGERDPAVFSPTGAPARPVWSVSHDVRDPASTAHRVAGPTRGGGSGR